jgi:hypothetical protein
VRIYLPGVGNRKGPAGKKEVQSGKKPRERPRRETGGMKGRGGQASKGTPGAKSIVCATSGLVNLVRSSLLWEMYLLFRL